MVIDHIHIRYYLYVVMSAIPFSIQFSKFEAGKAVITTEQANGNNCLKSIHIRPYSFPKYSEYSKYHIINWKEGCIEDQT